MENQESESGPATRESNLTDEVASNVDPNHVIQDYNQLRRECLERNTLFEDPEFPAQDSSIYYSKTPTEPIEWKRPTEIVEDPKLFVDGFSRFDLAQGDLQDCWFVAGAADLAMRPNLFSQVVPEDQSFEVNYAGIFHFRFWQYGRWVDVVVDDRLPTIQGELLFSSSCEKKEFWCSLLEKAYAKLNGSYESLIDGRPCESMEDFTGGVTESFTLNAIPPNLFDILLKAQERNALMGCMVERGADAKESETPEGLIRWHTYSITRVSYVTKITGNEKEKIFLLRLRNPWGKGEWNGKWSDQSPEWNFISDTEIKDLGLKVDVDGEFWINFQDFKHRFKTLDICNLSPDSLTDENVGKKNWELIAAEGKWVKGLSAGGCTNFPETFWQNPQYRITLHHPDEDDDKCSVIIALMQKNRRALISKGVPKLHIGFVIYHLPDPKTLPDPLDKEYFENHLKDYVATAGLYLDNREASCRFKFLPGVYCVVPCTFEPNQEGEFLLRIFTDSDNNGSIQKTEPVDVSEVCSTNEGCTLL